jgi:hypothetical protein
MSDYTAKELHEARKALASKLTQDDTASFVDTTLLTRWVGGQERVTGKRWVSYLTPRTHVNAVAAGQIDLAQIVPCTHQHTTKTSAIQCARKRHLALPAKFDGDLLDEIVADHDARCDSSCTEHGVPSTSTWLGF